MIKAIKSIVDNNGFIKKYWFITVLYFMFMSMAILMIQAILFLF